MLISNKFLKKCCLAILAAFSLASACTEEIPYVMVGQNAVVASQETTRLNIPVDSNSDWTAESRADWIRVYSGSGSGYGSFEMIIDSNHSASERNSEVVVSCPGSSAVITVIQSSSNLSLVTPVTDYYIGADAQDINLEFIVSCKDAAIKAFSNTDWAEIGGVADGCVNVSVAENTGGESRDAEVKIAGTGGGGKAVVNTVTIHQGGTDNILDVLVDSLSIASMGETVKVPVQTNAGIEAVSSSDWCSVSVSDKNVLISAIENMTGVTREAVVTVSVASQRGKPLSKAITVSQESVAVGVSIPIGEYSIDNAAQDVVVKYNLSSQDFNLEGASSVKWAEVVSVSDGAAVVAVGKNDGRNVRSAEIALTATNASGVAFTARTRIMQSETARDVLEILVPEVNVKAEGESMDIPFNASTEVTVKSSAFWCIAGVDGSDVVIEVSKNVGQPREAFITLTTAGGESGTIKITQAQSPDSVDLPVREVSAKSEGGAVRIPYTDKARASVSSNVDWCSASIGEGYIVATLDANSDENIREAYITVTTEDGSSGIIHILQAARSKDTLEVLTPEVKVVSSASTTRIPFVSNATVEARSSVEWIEVSVEGKDVVARISANVNEQPREGYITLTTEGGAVAVAHIFQDSVIPEKKKEPFLNVVVDVLYAPKEGASLNIPFASSSNVNAVATAGWASVEVDNKNGVALAVLEENTTGKDRNTFVVLTNKDGLSARVEIIQVSAGTLHVALTEFSVGYEGGTKTVPYEADGSVAAKTTEDWISASAGSDGNVVITVSANDGGTSRDGFVVLTDQSGNTAYIHINQACETKEDDSISALVTSVRFSGEESTIRLPLTAENIEGDLGARSSSDWLSGTIDGLDVIVHADENWSGETRTGYITVTSPEGATALITVNQTTLAAEFEFETTEIALPYTAESASTLLISTGAWKIVDKSSVPAWVTISPASGDGNSIITVTASSNKFANPRSAAIYFHNTEHNKTAMLYVVQEGNPNGLVEFLHLGKGYDVSGKYAEEAFVKGKVLDTDKLVAGDHIADLLTPNATVEEVVTGKTLSEYEEKYSANAGVSGEYMGFSASVEFNFSENARGTSEYSFATLRHMTKKQILKIYENETAAELKDCLTELFAKDVANAVAAKGNATKFADAAKALLDKYGTHVITGFSLGGVLEYSMAADASSNETETDWGLAVKAGFEQEGVGSVSTSEGYDQYSRLKTESYGFESKLVCRGGESQYTSSGYGDDAGKTAAAYVDWLSSLEDKSKWVLIDYEGSGLIPLWEFVDDADLASMLESLAKDRLKGLGQQQQSGYKTFEIIFVGLESTHGDGNDSHTEWEFNLSSTIDRKNSTKRTIYSTKNSGQIGVEQSTESTTYRATVDNATSGTFSLSKTQSHTVTIELTDCFEDDGGGALNDKKPDNSVTLTFEPGHDYWSYLGFRDGEANNTLFVYDKDATGNGINKEIYLYGGGDQSGEYVRFIFKINWK